MFYASFMLSRDSAMVNSATTLRWMGLDFGELSAECSELCGIIALIQVCGKLCAASLRLPRYYCTVTSTSYTVTSTSSLAGTVVLYYVADMLR